MRMFLGAALIVGFTVVGPAAGDTSRDATADVIFTKNNVNAQILREHPPNGSRVYGTVAEDGAISLVSDQGPGNPIRAGSHQLVVWDQSTRDPFTLIGPGVSFRTSGRYTGVFSWSVRLRAGATYHYRSDRSHHGTIRIKR